MPQFYDFLQNRILVNFKSRYEDNTGKAPDFPLILSKKMTYDVVRSGQDFPYSQSSRLD